MNKTYRRKKTHGVRFRTAAGIPAAVLSLALTGCATGTAGLGEEAGTAELPSGLTMLASTEGECEDSVHIGSGALADARLGPELFVQPGQNATYAVDEAPVNWACIDDDSREFHVFDCSEETTYVRVTRALEDGELLLECFG